MNNIYNIKYITSTDSGVLRVYLVRSYIAYKDAEHIDLSYLENVEV